jgi:hypothetical protein
MHDQNCSVSDLHIGHCFFDQDWSADSLLTVYMFGLFEACNRLVEYLPNEFCRQ